MGHAITPSASRPFASPTERRQLVAGPELTKAESQLLALALVIADGNARGDIESYCVAVVVDGFEWYDTNALVKPLDKHPEDRDFIDLALAYLAERGDEAGYRTLKHRLYPHLVRFEALT